MDFSDNSDDSDDSDDSDPAPPGCAVASNAHYKWKSGIESNLKRGEHRERMGGHSPSISAGERAEKIREADRSERSPTGV